MQLLLYLCQKEQKCFMSPDTPPFKWCFSYLALSLGTKNEYQSLWEEKAQLFQTPNKN